jgi:hypothetical protein
LGQHGKESFPRHAIPVHGGGRVAPSGAGTDPRRRAEPREPPGDQVPQAGTRGPRSELLELGRALGVGVMHVGEPEPAGGDERENITPAGAAELPELLVSHLLPVW